MNPEDFTLQPSNVPTSKLLDADSVSDAPWPMPVKRVWAPQPKQTLLQILFHFAARMASAVGGGKGR